MGRPTGAQQRPAAWSVEALKRALSSGTRAQDIAILKRIGLLTVEGSANPAAEDWGSRPSRTPTLEEMRAHELASPASPLIALLRGATREEKRARLYRLGLLPRRSDPIDP
jgi:hypothetical protein